MRDPNKRTIDARPVWDTYTLAVATAVPTLINMFGSCIGVNGKLLADTNLVRPWQLQVAELFHMRALRLVCLGMMETDIVKLALNYCFSLKISGEVRLEAPLEFWPGGAGVGGMATATDVRVLSNGIADPRAVASIPADMEILINGDDTIKLEIAGTTFTTATAALGGNGINLRAYLDGYYEKP